MNWVSNSKTPIVTTGNIVDVVVDLSDSVTHTARFSIRVTQIKGFYVS